MSTLYLVATPIGNLEDMSLRAIRVLREIPLIAAEDTRTTRVLLDRYQIQTRMTSYHEHNKATKLKEILAALDAGDVALVSDAGTPGISDPGYELVVAAIARGHTVTAIPGPCAAISALVVSGLPTDAFVFEGFPPRKAAALARWIERIGHEPRTIVLYEAPHRLTHTVEALAKAFPTRRLVLACELTKMFESVWRGTCAGALDHLRTHPPRGEYVLVLEGSQPEQPESWPKTRVLEELKRQLAAGATRRDAARMIAEQSGWNKRDVIALLHTSGCSLEDSNDEDLRRTED
ncbi:MAG: 16S rRNA (cytidine(1402)-2'-O)-methyltransferase [Anaerolineae bacterium]|nr:16S rRNA (cytidine(1402)-2'-O)-methyltransferase [Thermoflexales bacterium]MDW8407388.1 16S rRNA (cytidine(1402)-2'-O)-methyltransferase [Anaerolineae bacterium]